VALKPQNQIRKDDFNNKYKMEKKAMINDCNAVITREKPLTSHTTTIALFPQRTNPTHKKKGNGVCAFPLAVTADKNEKRIITC